MANRNVDINTGDGVSCAQIICTIVLPTAGTSISFIGSVQAAGGAVTPMTGTPATGPAAPGAGLSTNYILQVNTTTAAVAAKLGTPATTGTQLTPAADASNVAFFMGTVANAQTNLLYGDTVAQVIPVW
jgi:hypothetical protein